MFLLPYFGLLRCSEFMTPSSNFNPHPRLYDLQILDLQTILHQMQQNRPVEEGSFGVHFYNPFTSIAL